MNLKLLIGVLTVSMGLSGAALATHKAGHDANNPDAPGQNRVCLVTYKSAGATKKADIVRTQWLPQKAAEAQDRQHRDRAVQERWTQLQCEQYKHGSPT